MERSVGLDGPPLHYSHSRPRLYYDEDECVPLHVDLSGSKIVKKLVLVSFTSGTFEICESSLTCIPAFDFPRPTRRDLASPANTDNGI